MEDASKEFVLKRKHKLGLSCRDVCLAETKDVFLKVPLKQELQLHRPCNICLKARHYRQKNCFHAHFNFEILAYFAFPNVLFQTSGK